MIDWIIEKWNRNHACGTWLGPCDRCIVQAGVVYLGAILTITSIIWAVSHLSVRWKW